MKPTFLKYEKPLFTAMVLENDIEKNIGYIKNAVKNGAEAIGVQMCYLDTENQNEESFKRVISAAGDLPTYVTYYRGRSNEGKSDDEIAEGLVTLAKCGATLCDVVGDLYDKQDDQMARNEEAIKNQMALIDRLHGEGAEVLISSHILKFTPAERILEIALEQERRGADICKIVSGAGSHEEEIENLRIVTLLKKELKIPFLYLSGGECRILRRIGPMLGCCMWLCVDERNNFSAPPQPDLAQVKLIRENFGYFKA
ncbi:MAG: type I 3-dehydroquinate dehydratase [Ruminococcaceae bacterium]|nr:type I 3-dehydroquinate dehydratase [Oscillospiraceae bacterium]